MNETLAGFASNQDIYNFLILAYHSQEIKITPPQRSDTSIYGLIVMLVADITDLG